MCIKGERTKRQGHHLAAQVPGVVPVLAVTDHYRLYPRGRVQEQLHLGTDVEWETSVQTVVTRHKQQRAVLSIIPPSATVREPSAVS